MPSAPSSILVRGAAPQVGPPGPTVALPNPAALGATRFLAFGDSITFGTLSSFDGAFLYDAGSAASYPGQLQSLLTATFPAQAITIENRGKPGEWASEALSSGRFKQQMDAIGPQGLLLLQGINDLNNERSVSATVASLSQMIDVARLYNTTVLVSTMFQTCRSVSPSGTIRLNAADQVVPFNTALKAMAAGKLNVYVVDMYAAFGGNCGPDGGVGWLGADGLHPTADGYEVMASVFAQAIRQRFPVRGSYQ